MKTKDIDDSTKRELYKAMRSLHDGICPACGGKANPNWCEEEACDFELIDSEVRKIRKWHLHFHKDIKLIVKKWRKK